MDSTSGIEMGDGRVVNPDGASAEMGSEIATPNDDLKRRFMELVATRNALALNKLVTVEYPTILWGILAEELSTQDVVFVANALTMFET